LNGRLRLFTSERIETLPTAEWLWGRLIWEAAEKGEVRLTFGGEPASVAVRPPLWGNLCPK
jgi:hypothetical protein